MLGPPHVLPGRPRLGGLLLGRPENVAGVGEVRDGRAVRRPAGRPPDRRGLLRCRRPLAVRDREPRRGQDRRAGDGHRGPRHRLSRRHRGHLLGRDRRRSRPRGASAGRRDGDLPGRRREHHGLSARDAGCTRRGAVLPARRPPAAVRAHGRAGRRRGPVPVRLRLPGMRHPPVQPAARGAAAHRPRSGLGGELALGHPSAGRGGGRRPGTAAPAGRRCSPSLPS